MGFLDKLVAGGQKPPPYSNKPTNVNHSNEPSKMNPYPSVTSPVTPNTPNYLAGSANNQAPSSSDERPLPPGWVKWATLLKLIRRRVTIQSWSISTIFHRQWHDGYQRFFYVDTNAVGGPQSHWIHPSDQQPGQGQQRAGFGQPPMAQQPYYPQQWVLPGSEVDGNGDDYVEVMFFWPWIRLILYRYPQQPMYPQQPPQMMANNGRGRGGFNPYVQSLLDWPDCDISACLKWGLIWK